MSRPRKWRRVCNLPFSTEFRPVDCEESHEIIVMSVDEYETIRLIDLQEMTQEECSVQMDIARTTVQRIYNEARKKLADAVVNGKILRIEGGDYKICEGFRVSCACEQCRHENECEECK
ncbi:DUF134 domain-containing protein [Peptacetobacter hominis]|uniref:UPF0251 protein EXD82_09270 n=1 Tax=Peptacetobacter hominis TaxID=2743610 RepID=A0A544QTE4_9FIRM|nr:DUF134 domain-containing protein [Peptacetobacter hominis]TQQ83967.1 DUF134 domain-containing protein [Peptacetobacter hominis]